MKNRFRKILAGIVTFAVLGVTAAVPAFAADKTDTGTGSVTGNVTIVYTGSRFVELYNGRDDLPEEYKIFAYPAPEKSIRDTLKQYQQMIDAAPVASKGRPAPACEER